MYGCVRMFLCQIDHVGHIRQRGRVLREQAMNARARGLPEHQIYLDRFNLDSRDYDLMGNDHQDEAAPQVPLVGHDATHAWSNYIRFTFRPHFFYCFDGIDSNLFFLVARTRAAPGKDIRYDDAETLGRDIVHAWFERFDLEAPSIRIRPT